MDNTKRKLTSPESSEKNSKKIRNQLVNSIENLSNDLFYEIYDYLEGLDICVAFSNLNSRFQQLITCSTNRYKIIIDYLTTKELFWNYSKEFKHQIYSIPFQLPKSSVNEFLPIHYSFTDLNEIYQLIFSLPKLKSNKLDLFADEYSISIPMSNNQQFSSITCLHIAHSYTSDELSTLISYTPSLRHLNLSRSSNYDSYIEESLPMHLNELTHLSIYSNNLNFDGFQLFVEQINSKLQILHVFLSKQDIRFLHADRWQKLLLENFSKRWYQYSIEHSKLAQLTIKYIYSNQLPDVLLNQIKRILNFTQIYHLDIEQNISIARLMQIIHLLPDLISLKINDLSFYESSILRLACQESLKISALKHASNIKYVCLEKTCTMEDILFLISFCRHMEYLNIEGVENMNIQSFLSDILNKMNQYHYEYLHTLCIYITIADNQMIKQLEQMIDDENFLLDYTIHRQLYNIYLKWK
ncbi:unnamed protein product [Adineta steineri]|uniref:F-box domain-containing protein n=1 Tax=Adineta steineri TaxID=433720 RepID=A0A814LKJ5_9BILA|nr:unnamed protein product [Adineta steineri]CAF1066627.1 unnamed protein product [Adineta steineri]CAF1221599.1 unnamed protein product [Adineta steineri]